jgi:hypothetical protein
VLDLASRYRETLLWNAYRMGKNAIQRGSQDTWTASPRRLAELKAARGTGPAATAAYERMLRDPRRRDPRGYIIPADQPDFLTAVKFVDALLKAGVTVHRATAPFTTAGRQYPAGTFVVMTAQAFRPHVLDMFEPQDHPADVDYPGGPPAAPYDITGWTLAFQMGIDFDRVLEGFSGPFEKVTEVTRPAGRVTGSSTAVGYLLGHHQNDAFTAVNRLLAAGEDVRWLRDRTAGSAAHATGAMYIAARESTLPILQQAAADLGLMFTGVPTPPPGGSLKLRPVRIGLWDRYGGASTSGWTRWLLERYEFPFEVVHAQALDAGDLASRYDVLILPDEAVPGAESRANSDAPSPDRLPAEYRGTTGTITRERTIPQLKAFVEGGGTLLTIGRATAIGSMLGVPVSSALVERLADGTPRPLTRDRYYIPGSILRIRVDNTTPLGFGFEPEVDVFFDDSPVFRLPSGAAARGARRVAWFASADPLRSGWALGQQYLQNGAAVLDAPLGRGRVLLFGPEINFRAQSHGTFKFLFNGIFYSRALPAD